METFVVEGLNPAWISIVGEVEWSNVAETRHGILGSS